MIAHHLPKYCLTWSVHTVLKLIKNLGAQNTEISLVHLTYKTVILLLVTRPSKAADPVSLDDS